jgi:glycine hydroxymethyltransferase
MKSELEHLKSLCSQQWKYENSVINLIASDNACDLDLGLFQDYPAHIIQEGLLGDRPFAGARLHDELESYAAQLACEVFEADHANIQPHSCSQANQAAYQALLQPGDRVLALGFKAGGHLTHGLKINFSGRAYDFAFYGLDSNGIIDYESLASQVIDFQPKLVVCGSSSYPRRYDVDRLRDAADSVGAYLMLDLSHEAGLIAGGAYPNPVPQADVVTMSLDKTLRGPFGGMILCKSSLAKKIDSAVHPGVQSSFPIRKLISAAHSLILTKTPEFGEYAERVIKSAQEIANVFTKKEIPILTDGTDKHYVVVDVEKGFGCNGMQAETLLEEIGILSSRQVLPRDESARSNQASGLRIATAWISSRGYQSDEAREVATLVTDYLSGAMSPVEAQRHVSRLASLPRTTDIWRKSPNVSVFTDLDR